MAHRTPLHAAHRALGARMVNFAGWDMPLHYGSQIEEHHHVRRAAGMFDVSHMRAVDFSGDDARDFLRLLLANDIARIDSPAPSAAGRALYTCMLNPAGGVIDDLIVYRRAPESYRLVLNAATTDSDLAWISKQAAPFALRIARRDDLAMLAIQGPQARARTLACLPPGLQAAAEALAPFAFCEQAELFVARTGYTGEDGFEILLPNAEAPALWRALLETGVQPCGLGARDTLRLEAGMHLSGQDMGSEVSPLDCGLGWTIAWEPPQRDFIGRAALESKRAQAPETHFIGVLLDEPGVLRAGQALFSAAAGDGESIGRLTSGGFSPTLGRSIGLARINTQEARDCTVEIRGRRLAARLVKPPFARHGQVRIAL